MSSINCTQAIWTLFWQNLLKFYDKIDLSIPIRIIYNVRRGKTWSDMVIQFV